MDATVEWVDARWRYPDDGAPVAAAVTGTYPPREDGDGPDHPEDYWIVLPMHFERRHFAGDGTEHHDCFVDSDGVIRFPYGGPPCEEPVTHWAALPTLPGLSVHLVLGEAAPVVVRETLEAGGGMGGNGQPR
ncbi:MULTISPECIES: AQJ64_40280 family protein [unclassified Streptomyces]|uniref:AQJ64_40280 family protein n=1 Tax=unclassified Streptomyces TaxID=2593676 RepID=UPI0005275A2E|nr:MULTISPECIES: AQJ64_40280 family protein [unclassified Streptomyces]